MSSRGQELFPSDDAIGASSSFTPDNGVASREEALRRQLLARRITRNGDRSDADSRDVASNASTSRLELRIRDASRGSPSPVEDGERKDGQQKRSTGRAGSSSGSRTPPFRRDDDAQYVSRLADRISGGARLSNHESRHRGLTPVIESARISARSPRRSSASPNARDRSTRHALPARPDLPARPRSPDNGPSWRLGDLDRSPRRLGWDDRGGVDNRSRERDRWEDRDGRSRPDMDRPPHMDNYATRVRADKDRRGAYGSGPRRDFYDGGYRREDGYTGDSNRGEFAAGRQQDAHGRVQPPVGRDNGYGRPVMPVPLPPQRVGFDGPPRHYSGSGNGYGNGQGYRGFRGAVDFEQCVSAHHASSCCIGDGLTGHRRRLQREASTISVWPPSPKEPRRNDRYVHYCI